MFYRFLLYIIFFCTVITSAQENGPARLDTTKTEPRTIIDVTSTPSNAKIFINDRETQYTTPALLTDVKTGLNTIEARLPDYLFAKRQVNVIADTTIYLSFKLISLSDTAHIIGDLQLGILNLPQPPLKTPYLIDNKQVYSQEVTLNAGKHHVVWEGGNRYSSLDTIVEIFPGKLTTFQFTPERLYGDLTISPFPRDADIYINNRLYSTGDLHISLSTGTYNITVRRNGYYPVEQQIIIAPVKHISLEIDLDMIPDRDSDGFLDSLDICPDVYGLYGGCPKQNRRDAIKRYKDILLGNMKKQPLIFSINMVGYINRRPKNISFREFLSYFNDGDFYLNNRNGLVFANTYTISFCGFLLSCELGQWFSGLEYKKNNFSPLVIKTNKDQYCLYYDDSLARITSKIILPSTAVSAGFNLTVKRFNASYTLGYQWENIIITDLVPKTDLEKYFLKDPTVCNIKTQQYIGRRVNIIFDNNWWFHKLRFEYDLMRANKAIPSIYMAMALSFGSKKRQFFKIMKTGWHVIQVGILYKFFPTSKRKIGITTNNQENNQ